MFVEAKAGQRHGGAGFENLNFTTLENRSGRLLSSFSIVLLSSTVIVVSSNAGPRTVCLFYATVATKKRIRAQGLGIEGFRTYVLGGAIPFFGGQRWAERSNTEVCSASGQRWVSKEFVMATTT